MSARPAPAPIDLAHAERELARLAEIFDDADSAVAIGARLARALRRIRDGVLPGSSEDELVASSRSFVERVLREEGIE